ncbi:MAG: hypothetical protein ABIC40_08055, partial [bacterium]
MYEFLINIGIHTNVAEFIAHPEWIHIGTAFILILALLGVAYILRVDLDPFVFGKTQPFGLTIERFIFYPAVIGILLWTYYFQWFRVPLESTGKPIIFEKFQLGIALLLILIIGRAVAHFVLTEKNRRDFFDQLPFYLLVEFQFMVPLVYYFQLERNGLMPKEELGFAFACLFLCYFAVRWLIGRSTYLPRNPIHIWLWLFIAYMLFTLIAFPYRLAAIKNVIQWITFAACFLMALAYVPDKRRRDAILMTAIIAASVSTLWGFWKYFDMPLRMFGMVNDTYPTGHDLAGQTYFYKTPSAGRYFLLAGFFANPNYYGEYLALTIFIALGLLLSTDSRKLKLFLGIVLAINSFEMVALYNRAGWLGIFFGAFVVLLGMVFAKVSVFRRVSKIGLIGGIAALILVFTLTGLIFNRRETDDTPLSTTPLERLKSMADFGNDETFKNRLTMWRAAG